ncbi:MAG: TetR/AcrR family transcriptional regulator [Sphingosinicella sp.]|nr:TetR/AcrR family transcriptional regulator [Sphingosinicella sp.]
MIKPETSNVSSQSGAGDVRERILATASDLFYRQGVRAVGVDLIVEQAGVAKTSLYRHFPAKDDLIRAFLEREDEDFWRKWDQVAVANAQYPAAELEAHFQWIGERVARPHYRGCPQLNVAAEFPDLDHPARAVAFAHKIELRRRLKTIIERMDIPRPDELALQLAIIINGAFLSAQLLADENPAEILIDMMRAQLAVSRL